jgi:hypothetical protein
MVREPEELGIADKGAALEPEVARDDRLHLIEEQLLRHTAERDERVLQAVDQRGHVLARIEPAPEHPRVAEHDEQRIAHAPGKSKAREVHLRLATGRRLEADDGLGRGRRADALHERFQLRVPTGVPAARISSSKRTADSSG